MNIGIKIYLPYEELAPNLLQFDPATSPSLPHRRQQQPLMVVVGNLFSSPTARLRNSECRSEISPHRVVVGTRRRTAVNGGGFGVRQWLQMWRMKVVLLNRWRRQELIVVSLVHSLSPAITISSITRSMVVVSAASRVVGVFAYQPQRNQSGIGFAVWVAKKTPSPDAAPVLN